MHLYHEVLINSMFTKIFWSLSVHHIIKTLTTLTALVSLWVIIHTAIMSSLITDEEYLSGSRDTYQMSECEYRWDNTWAESLWANLTPKQIEKKISECERNARQDILSRRAYQSKTMLISSSIRFIFALIIYVVNNGYMRSEP